MAMYLFKSAACLAIFYGFYILFLERESFHKLKRYYLLASLVFAFSIPLITFTEYVEIPLSSGTTTLLQSSGPTDVTATTTQVFPWSELAWSIYILGVLLFGFKFGKNLWSMLQKIRRNPHVPQPNLIHVLVQAHVIPHTFLRYIFFNKAAYQEQAIPEEVLCHEAAHARQFHTLDLLLVEFLRIAFWFNPFLYWMRERIKLNHEFLADRAVLNQGTRTEAYQNILLAYSSNAGHHQLAHAINYSSFKKRFSVMKKQTSYRRKFLYTAVMLPLVAILVYGFSSTQKKLTYTTDASLQQMASPKEVAQYNAMAEFWNERFAETAPERAMPLSELGTLERLYNTMSPDQKENARPFPVCNPAGKRIHLWIQGFNIKLDNQTTSLAQFANTMDRITAEWSSEDYENSSMEIQLRDAKPDFLKKLQQEYEKTDLYSHKKNALIPPPPPAPPVPSAPSGVPEPPSPVSGVPDAPAPTATPAQPTPPKPIMGVMLLNIPKVGPVPDLTNPVELINYIDELGVPFYLDMKKISKEEALEIVKKNTLEVTWRPHADDGEPKMLFSNGC